MKMAEEKLTKAGKLRKMLNGGGLIKAPGAYDVWSAKLVEEAGFDAVYMTGYGVSASVLGKPDIGIMTFSEVAAMARNMARALNIPLIADCDTGFGTSLNVIRCVREFEEAGVAAIQFEDQVMPKRCGHMEGKELIPKEDMVQKLKAAVYARKDPDFVIIARTDARAVNGMDDAIERANAYVEAGADVIFLEAPLEKEEIIRAANGPHQRLLHVGVHLHKGVGSQLLGHQPKEHGRGVLRQLRQQIGHLGRLHGREHIPQGVILFFLPQLFHRGQECGVDF